MKLFVKGVKGMQNVFHHVFCYKDVRNMQQQINTQNSVLLKLAEDFAQASQKNAQNQSTMQHLMDDAARVGVDVRQITENLKNNNHQIAQIRKLNEADTYPHQFDYVGFEKRFRGEENEIKKRQAMYLRLFANLTAPVVDIGCGRGEFLELLQEAGIPALGVEQNTDFVIQCRQKGLDIHQQDALEYLYEAEDCSLGGVIMNQVIEHIPFDKLVEIVAMIYAKLMPGAYLIVETINPRSLIVFTEAFFLDPTHDHMLHPFTVRFLFEQFGFRNTQVQYLSPVELDDVSTNNSLNEDVVANTSMAVTHRLLFAHREYSVIGRKPQFDGENPTGE